MSEVISYLPQFIQAMGMTLYISIAGSLLGIIFAFLLFYLKHIYEPIQYAIKTYIWIIRGTPFLSQLMVIYFGLPMIGLTLSAEISCVIALGFYSAAYFYEIFRSAWNSIPNGQLEAAAVHGISPARTLLYVQLPQALAFSMPMIGNQLILIIKESSIASVITVPELTMTTGSIVSTNFSYVIPYGLMIICYWIMTEAVGTVASKFTFSLNHYKRG